MIDKMLLFTSLEYSPATGYIFWKKSRKKAGGVNKITGYHTVRLKGKSYYTHRLAFLFMGKPLPEEVDHINHIRDDNRWINLKEATTKSNKKNSPKRIDNTSGTTGVSFDVRRNKWYSRIFLNGRNKFLGYYQNKEDAIKAREDSNREHSYNNNHGKESKRYARRAG